LADSSEHWQHRIMHAIDLVFVVGWIAFWVYWFAAATRVKSGRVRWGQFAGVRVVLALVVIILVRIRAFRGHDVHDAVLAGIGLVLWALGLALAVWARIHLGSNWGTPMTEKNDPDLVTTGPYRRIRNPIYAGLILAIIGTAVAVSTQWLVVAALVGAYFVYSAVMEQRFMATTFPDTYPAYRNSTKMLIPFIF
jgi:protein-S-isoprenylcysteine O-methyltransferase Ste14